MHIYLKICKVERWDCIIGGEVVDVQPWQNGWLSMAMCWVDNVGYARDHIDSFQDMRHVAHMEMKYKSINFIG